MTNYESLIKELSESAIMGQRFIGLIKRWEINNEPPPRFEPMYVHVPAAIMWRDSNGPSLVLFPSRANGDKSVSLTQRTNTSMGHRTMMPRSLRQHTVAEHTAVCHSGEAAVASVPPGLQMSRSRSHSPSAGLHSSTTKKTTNRRTVLLLHRSKIPRGQSEPRGRSATKNEVTRTTSSTNLPELSGSTSPSSGSHGPTGGLTRTKSVADLSPMAIEEDDDLIGLPVPLSYKRRREEDEEEGLERLAKRPALAGKEKEKGRERSSERVSQRTRAVSPAPSRSAADEVAEGSGSGRTAGSGTPSQKLRLKVRLGGKGAGPPSQGSPPPHTSVKVGDKG